jgi:adenine-specific DNA-methyltransferase
MARKQGHRAESYRHEEATRAHIPESGNVDYVPKAKPGQAEYCFDPRLSAQLAWAGKAGLRKVEFEEEMSLEVPDVSLHIHERVKPEAVLRAGRRQDLQRALFANREMPFSQDVQYYQHDVGWSNRMILGD